MHDSRFYLVNEYFDDISSVLLGAYWDDITLLQRGKSVKSALQKSPKQVDKDNHAKAIKYFSHVIIYLSPGVIENDRRAHNCQGVNHLCEIFKGVHREHFSALTSAEDDIRYQVLPGVGLSEKQAVVAFGRCVYLPAELEKPAYKLNFSVEGGGFFCLPVYQNQRLALVNNKPYGAQQAFVDWPFDDYVSVLILQDKLTGQLEVLSEPDGVLMITANDAEHCYQITGAQGHSLNLQVHALTARQPATAAVEKEEPVSKHSFDSDGARGLHLNAMVGDAKHSASYVNLDERTFIKDTPDTRTLNLVGIALQRLSKFQQYGFKQLRIGFSYTGDIVDPDDSAAIGILELDAEGHLCVGQGGLFQAISLPYKWCIHSGLVLEINPPVLSLADDYVAFVHLVKPLVFNLEYGVSQSFGRGSAAQIAPRLLTTGQMISVDNSKPTESLEQLGFSREVAKFKVDNKGLEVLPLNSNSLWHLKSDGHIVGKIEKYAAHVLPNEFLLSGHYLFCFAG